MTNNERNFINVNTLRSINEFCYDKFVFLKRRTSKLCNFMNFFLIITLRITITIFFKNNNKYVLDYWVYSKSRKSKYLSRDYSDFKSQKNNTNYVNTAQ